MPRHRKNKCRHGTLRNKSAKSHFDGASLWFVRNVKRTRRRNQIASASRRVNRQLAKGK